MSLTVQTLIPSEAILNTPKSTSKNILRKRQVEILPNEQTSFTYTSNDTIRFNISSSTEMMDGLDSYIKMNVVCVGNDDRVLEVGGAHSFFREMTLQTQSGTIIQKQPHYNTWYAMMSMATHSPQHVELMEAPAGDSVSVGEDIIPTYKSFTGEVTNSTLINVPLNGRLIVEADEGKLNDTGVAYYNSADKSFHLGTGSVAGSVSAGDELYISVMTNDEKINDKPTGLTYYAKVVNIINDVNDGVVFSIGAPGVNNNVTLDTLESVGDGIIHISKINRNVVSSSTGTYVSQRTKVARSTTEVPLVFKPALSFLQQKQWLPLPFIKQGLQLELKLDRPEYVLNKLQAPNVQDDGELLNYTISRPRYVCMMIMPEKQIMAEYATQFNGEGIHMTYLAYAHSSQRIPESTSGSSVVNHLFGVRSARHVISLIQSSRISQEVSRSSKGNFSLSTFFRSFLSQYQYKCGSEEYPEKPVLCDNFSTEAFSQLLLATGQHGGTLWNVRFSPSEWRNDNEIISSTSAAPNVNTSLTNRSIKFMMATRLDRDSNSPFTGLDLSINPLDLEMYFDQGEADAFGDRIIQTFVAYDVLTSISSSGFLVRR